MANTLNVECECGDWKISIPALDDVISSAWVHGVHYTGSKFVYCPWCGKKLASAIKLADLDSNSSVRA